MVIQRLPVAIVNQIAAGEVVERPVSVVKELVENSLDAGATRIRVEIRAGGAEQLVVVDDGEGFLPEDLPLAFASHATSKLQRVQDLEHIASLGFRGEALASIGAVSKASVQSRRREHAEGWQVRCDGGDESEPSPCGCPVGTRIEVRDLFFNVPARRRFLKAAHAERARIQQLVCELALARLDVDFTLVSDDKELLRMPRGVTLAERMQQCFGRELGGGLIPVARSFDGLRIEGVVGDPDLARRDGRLELTYVNGRLAGEKSALHAVRQAYREFLMHGRFPVYVLQVALPPEQVDVNIHPRKAEVRFVDPRKVAGCLHATVSGALRERALPPPEHAAGDPSTVSGSALPRPRTGFPNHTPSLFTAGSRAGPVPARGDDDERGFVVRETSAPQHGQPAVERPNPFRRVSGRYLQIMDLYLLLESDDGLMVVDQHALHERVVYERLRAQHAARDVRMQRLMTPVVVELTPTEQAWCETARDDLAAEGLLLEPFGPTSVAVQGMPLVLSRTDPAQLVRALVAAGSDSGRAAVGEQIAERFHSMACRGSVMSGDRLSDDEIGELLRSAAELEHPHNCPHGRPTVLTFGAAELERYFRRRC